MLFTFGIISFGFVFHLQTVLDNAAREAVRVAAIDRTDEALDLARAAARDAAAGSVDLAELEIAFSRESCDGGGDIRATVSLPDHRVLGGFFGTIDITGTGTMRCNG